MKNFSLIALTTLLLSADAFATTLSCKVVGTKTEVDQADLNDGETYTDLNKFLSAKSATIEVNAQKATLSLFDKNDVAITLPLSLGYHDGKYQYKDLTSVEMTPYKTKAYTQRGEIAFYNDNITLLDDSYGVHFDMIFNQAELTSKASVLHVRLWTASVGEPDDDSGKQSLWGSSNISLICK